LIPLLLVTIFFLIKKTTVATTSRRAAAAADAARILDRLRRPNITCHTQEHSFTALVTFFIRKAISVGILFLHNNAYFKINMVVKFHNKTHIKDKKSTQNDSKQYSLL